MIRTSESGYCPIKNSDCNVKPEIFGTPSCFVAIPFRPEWKDTRKTITNLLKKYKITPYVADEDVTTGRDILCKVCEKITNSDFGVMEISVRNPNVMIEFGLTLGRRKPVFILYNKTTSEQKNTIPVDITALDRIEYTNQDILAERFEMGLKRYLQRVDVSKKRIQTLANLVKGMASDGKLDDAESLANALSAVIYSSGKRDGLLIDVIASLYENADPDKFNFLRYGGTLTRLLSETGNVEDATRTFNTLIETMRKPVIIGYQKRDQVKKSIARANLRGFARSAKHPEYGRPIFWIMRDIASHGRRSGEFELEVFYQEMWRLLFDAGEKRTVLIRAIAKYLTTRLTRARRLSTRRRMRILGLRFWEDEILYALIAWILKAPKLEAKELNIRFGLTKRSINRLLPTFLGRT